MKKITNEINDVFAGSCDCRCHRLFPRPGVFPVIRLETLDTLEDCWYECRAHKDTDDPNSIIAWCVW